MTDAAQEEVPRGRRGSASTPGSSEREQQTQAAQAHEEGAVRALGHQQQPTPVGWVLCRPNPAQDAPRMWALLFVPRQVEKGRLRTWWALPKVTAGSQLSRHGTHTRLTVGAFREPRWALAWQRQATSPQQVLPVSSLGPALRSKGRLLGSLDILGHGPDPPPGRLPREPHTGGFRPIRKTVPWLTAFPHFPRHHGKPLQWGSRLQRTLLLRDAAAAQALPICCCWKP